MDIYLLIDGQQQGPFTEEQIQTSLPERLIPSEFPAWHEGLADWATVAKALEGTSDPRTPPPDPDSPEASPTLFLETKMPISRHAIATPVLALMGIGLFPLAGFFAFIPAGVESFLATRSIKKNGYRGGWMVKFALWAILVAFIGVIAFATLIASHQSRGH